MGAGIPCFLEDTNNHVCVEWMEPRNFKQDRKMDAIIVALRDPYLWNEDSCMLTMQRTD